MEIKLIRGPRMEPETVTVPPGTTILELLKGRTEDLPYQILAARVNNKTEALTFPLEADGTVELLDMRNQAANLIYQYSLSLIYLKAIYDLYGKVEVIIEHSLNKGLFTKIELGRPLSREDVERIEARMREIVDLDLAFQLHVTDYQDARARLLSDGQREKLRLLQKVKDREKIRFYSLDGTVDFFYGLMVPSSGYVRHFQLRKYRGGVLLRFPHPKDPGTVPPYVDEKKLYGAFLEESRWADILEVRYVSDLNEKILKGEAKELIQLSEALHEKRIAEIADMISREGRRIVLIAGPSSSGKTTFAQRLCIQLRVNGHKPLYLGTDDYYVEREDTPRDEYGEMNFEDLEAIDLALFNRQLNDLLEGKTVDIPHFDFLRGVKLFGRRPTQIREDQPIVIEGIHGLNRQLTADLPDEEKFRIYISPFTQLNIDEHNRIPTTDARMLRRMVRDYRFRGYSAQRTIELWPRVRAGEDKNIFPFSNEADVLFNSAHIYELSVLRKYAEPLLSEISRDQPEYAEAARMLNFIRFFEIIEDDSPIVNNSIIREFIGGSVFV